MLSMAVVRDCGFELLSYHSYSPDLTQIKRLQFKIENIFFRGSFISFCRSYIYIKKGLFIFSPNVSIIQLSRY